MELTPLRGPMSYSSLNTGIASTIAHVVNVSTLKRAYPGSKRLAAAVGWDGWWFELITEASSWGIVPFLGADRWS